MKRFTLYSLTTVLLTVLILSGCGPKKEPKNTKNANVDLKTLTIDQGTLNPPFAPRITSYTVNVIGESVTVTGSAADSKAIVSHPVTLDDLEAGVERTVNIMVSVKGVAKIYTIKVTRVFAEAKAITAFGFPSLAATGVINETEHTIAVAVPARTNLTALTPAIDYTGVSIQPVAGTEQDFTTPVVYTVTAEDDSTQDYTVSVTFAPDTTPPAEVTGLTAVEASTQATLNWTPPGDEDFAGVEITASPEIPLTPTITVLKGTNTAKIENLENELSYTFTVKSFDEDGNRSSGAILTVIPWADAPAGIVFTIEEAKVPGARKFPTTWDDSVLCTTVNYRYYMSKYELTYGLWTEVYEWATNDARGEEIYHFQNPGKPGNWEGEYDEYTIPLLSELPITSISWRDAVVWCNALTEYYNTQNGTNLGCVYTYAGIIRDSRNDNATACDEVVVDLNAKGFRLPTDLEWELAARYIGPNQPTVGRLRDEAIFIEGLYWTPGNYASGARANTTDPPTDPTQEVAMCDSKAYTISYVGSKLPNALDIYDMSGHVMEWCFDQESTEDAAERFPRGGWSGSTPPYVAVGRPYPVGFNPGYFGMKVGFRPVRTK